MEDGGEIPENFLIRCFDQIVFKDIALGGEGLDTLKALVEQEEPDLLLLDPLRFALDKGMNLKDDEQLVKIVLACQSLVAIVPRMAVVLVHHLKKRQESNRDSPSLLKNPDSWTDQVYGGQALLGHVEFILGFEEDEDVNGFVFHSTQRSQPGMTFLLGQDDYSRRFYLQEESAQLHKVFTTAPQLSLWKKLLGEFTYAEGEEMASSKGLLDSVIKKARGAGLLRNPSRGCYVKVHLEDGNPGDSRESLK